MTAPRVRRKDRGPGFSQLSIYIHTPAKNALQQAAELEGRPQREVLEEALTDYFEKRRRPALPAKQAVT